MSCELFKTDVFIVTATGFRTLENHRLCSDTTAASLKCSEL